MSGTSDMRGHDDQWLDELLAAPPRVADGQFTQMTLQRIKSHQYRRLKILGAAWIVALLIILLTSPWHNLLDWIQLWNLPEGGGLIPEFNFSTDSVNREEVLKLVRGHWSIAVAVLGIVAVFIRNVFVHNT